MNHPFLDANKRTGILSGVVFLTLNGNAIRAERDALYRAAVSVEDESMSLADLATWFEDNSLPLTETEMEEVGRLDLRERFGDA